MVPFSYSQWSFANATRTIAELEGIEVADMKFLRSIMEHGIWNVKAEKSYMKEKQVARD